MTMFIEEIPGDTDEGHPAIDTCTICGKVCEPTYRKPVGEFPVGSTTYDYYCTDCGQMVMGLHAPKYNTQLSQDEIVHIDATRTHTTVTFTQGRFSCSCGNPFNRIYPFRMQPIDREIEPYVGT